ncbi:MAG: AMP-binding protein, partial [Acidimicrobiales bacterium]
MHRRGKAADTVLGELVAEAGRRFGDAPSHVAAEGWPLSYRQLDRCSDELAAGLAARGVREGDVVAVVLPTVPEWFVAYLAAAKLGAVTAGVNWRLSVPEREAVLRVARPRLVLATPELAPSDVEGWGEVATFEPATRGAGEMLASTPRLRRLGEAPPPLRPDPDRPVALIFTSGTTGHPKGAIYANRQLAAVVATDQVGQRARSARSSGQSPGPAPAPVLEDRWGGGGRSLAGTALAHLGTMTKLAGHLRGGGTVWLTHRWRADEALRLIGEHRMTVTGGIPTQVAL